MDAFQQGILEWCRDQRDYADRALKRYEAGRMRFFVGQTDVTESQKESLRRVIEEMDSMIETIEASVGGST